MGRRESTAALSLVAALAACGVPDFVPPPSPPEILRFEVQPFTVPAGAPVTVRWATAGATRVRLEGLEPDPILLEPEGARRVVPTTDLELTLVAENEAGARRARGEARISTEAPVRITQLELAPPRFRRGAPVQVRWRTENARAAWLRVVDQGPALRVPPNGTTLLAPRAGGIISLTAEGSPAAVTATRALTLADDTPVILGFYAAPDLTTPDTSAVLFGASAGAERARVWEALPDGDELVFEVPDNRPTGGNGTLSFNYELGPRPPGRHRFTLEIEGAGRTLSESTELAVLAVGEPSIDSFTVTPTTTGRGGQVTVAWATSNASAVRLAMGRDVLPSLPRAGSRVFTVTGAVRALLTADPSGRPVSAAVDVAVPPGWPRIEDVWSLGPSPTGTATVGWLVGGADEVEVRADETLVATSTEAAASVVLTLDTATDVRVVAKRALGRAERALRLVPGPTPRIERFEVEASAARVGHHLAVEWATADADRVELVAFGRRYRLPAAGRRYLLVRSSVLPLELTATNAAGEAQEAVALAVLPATSQLEVEPNDSFANANTPFGILPAVVSGTLLPGDVDVYAVEANTNGRVALTTNTLAGCPAGLVLEVWRDLGSEGRAGPLAVVGGTEACPEIDVVTAPQVTATPGPYFVLVYRVAQDNLPADYDLRALPSVQWCGDGAVDAFEDCDDGNNLDGDGCSGACTREEVSEGEPNDTAELARPWTGPTMTGFRRPLDLDWFSFEVTTPGPVRIWMEDEAAQCQLAARLQVFDEDQTLRAESSEGPCPELSGPQMVLEAGVYTLVVAEAAPSAGASRGRYTLRRSP